MRCAGEALFAEADLSRMLQHSMNVAAREAVFGALMEEPEVTRHELKRVVRAATTMIPLVLGEASPGALLEVGAGSPTLVELTCTVPFAGDAQLLRCWAPIWPPAREVKGTLNEASLALTVEGWSGDEAWFPAVAGSELAEVERIVEAQEFVINRHNRELPSSVDALVDRVYPRIDIAEFSFVYLPLLIPYHPRTAKMIDERVPRDRDRLWRKWSR